MGKLKLEELKLDENQKNGIVNLSEEQEKIISDSNDPWDSPPAEDSKPDPLSKDKKSSVKDDDDVDEEIDVIPDDKPDAEAVKKAQAEEQVRLDAKAKELNLPIEDVLKLEEAEEEAALKEQERIEAKAKAEGKSIEEITEAEQKALGEAEQARLDKMAKEEGVTVDQYRELEKKDAEIVKRHGGDIKDPAALKLARALRKQQSEYTKTKNELDAIEQEATLKGPIIDMKVFEANCEKERNELVAAYRQDFPEDTAAGEDDDLAFERSKAAVLVGYKQKHKSVVHSKAEEKRKALLETVPGEVKSEFSSEIQDHLNQCTDEQVLSPRFNMEHVIQFQRGKKYTPEFVKKMTDEAYRRGMENKRILSVRQPSGSKPIVPKKSSGSTDTYGLNQYQQKRALDMFEGTNMSDSDKYREYSVKYKDKDF